MRPLPALSDLEKSPVSLPMGRAKPAYHHGNLRAALVEAGLLILDQDGINALSLRKVGAHVGVSHTAPKNHFASMRMLKTALATEGFWRLAKTLKDAGPDGDAIARAYSAFALGHPDLYLLMFAPAECNPNDPDLSEAEGAARQMLMPAPEKPRRKHDQDQLERQIWTRWSLLHGHASLLLSGRLPAGATQAEDTTPDLGAL